ncbi:MAG TPA: hypothetical protein ENG05_02595 [Acidilobales archaeon]|nr:hypothetical protein [Acidilobales archaeon]
MAKALIKLVSLILELILRALFIGNDAWYKHSSIALNISLAALIITMVREANLQVLFYAMAIIIALHTVLRTLKLFTYSLIMSFIPSLWYLVTTLPFTQSIIESAIISLRVLVTSTSVLTAIFLWNPMELSYLLHKLRLSKGITLFAPFLWKVIPHVLKDVKDSILANELKGEKVWKGLAVSFLSVAEYSSNYEEALYLKVDDFKPFFRYDSRVISLILGFEVLVINYLIFKYFII